MSPQLKAFIQAWLINTLAVLVATRVIDGISYETSTDLIIATLVLGVLNALVRPFLLVLSLPLLLFTLGLFTLVINALLLYAVSGLVKEFHVASFWVACKAALLMAVISLVLNSLVGTGTARVQVKRPPPRRKDSDGPGPGPVIDV
ncbi:MAG: phage holin family protein [Verrucomicrobiota bacterium]